jgi:hypothetical protein
VGIPLWDLRGDLCGGFFMTLPAWAIPLMLSPGIRNTVTWSVSPTNPPLPAIAHNVIEFGGVGKRPSQQQHQLDSSPKLKKSSGDSFHNHFQHTVAASLFPTRQYLFQSLAFDAILITE